MGVDGSSQREQESGELCLDTADDSMTLLS
jgi:hypothetical protein